MYAPLRRTIYAPATATARQLHIATSRLLGIATFPHPATPHLLRTTTLHWLHIATSIQLRTAAFRYAALRPSCYTQLRRVYYASVRRACYASLRRACYASVRLRRTCYVPLRYIRYCSTLHLLRTATVCQLCTNTPWLAMNRMCSKLVCSYGDDQHCIVICHHYTFFFIKRCFALSFSRACVYVSHTHNTQTRTIICG